MSLSISFTASDQSSICSSSLRHHMRRSGSLRHHMRRGDILRHHTENILTPLIGLKRLTTVTSCSTNAAAATLLLADADSCRWAAAVEKLCVATGLSSTYKLQPTNCVLDVGSLDKATYHQLVQPRPHAKPLILHHWHHIDSPGHPQIQHDL